MNRVRTVKENERTKFKYKQKRKKKRLGENGRCGRIKVSALFVEHSCYIRNCPSPDLREAFGLGINFISSAYAFGGGGDLTPQTLGAQGNGFASSLETTCAI